MKRFILKPKNLESKLIKNTGFINTYNCSPAKNQQILHLRQKTKKSLLSHQTPMKKKFQNTKLLKKKKPEKLTKMQKEGLEIMRILEKLQRPSGIKDVVKWMR